MNTADGMKRIGLACVFVLAVAGLRGESHTPPVMYAHFIDVGQGACTLLEFPCGAILIDTGADKDARIDALVTYLNRFFAGRPDLNRTLKSVIVTHQHIDHSRGLKKVIQTFTVERYIDDGEDSGSGRFNPKWVRGEVEHGRLQIKVRPIRQQEIDPLADGLTDADIDPIRCGDCDPRICVLAGGFDAAEGWHAEDIANPNNQSLVIRVDFGTASFLFTGDLEEAGIHRLVTHYGPNGLLDVDVFAVGHHGSCNATTPALLEAVTPRIAVLATGKSTDGKDPFETFSTFAYGHPRIEVLRMLNGTIPGRRSAAVMVPVAYGARNFKVVPLRKQIYATGWDGTVKVRATLDGRYTVTREQN